MTQPLPPERSEQSFDDYKAAYTPQQAVVEANRCLFCVDAPCIKACPTGIEIPQFIRKIATGNLWGSARTIFDANILGTSCARVCPVEVLCVGDCVLNEAGIPPIQIGRLQRFATDSAVAAGWRLPEAGADTGKSVGIVGGGPAGLACAHELRRRGHRVTVYERSQRLGGLNTTGVAPYKMRADVGVEEAEWVLGIGGVEVKTGVEVGRDLSWEQLESQHNAVFVGFGLGADTTLDVAGSDLPGVSGAVAWIERMKLGKVPVDVAHAVVVGGGNTAIDVVRELCGLGVGRVTMLYRGTQAGMPGYAHEWEAAQHAGAAAAWQALPVAFEGDGKVERIRCIRLDDRKQPIAGTEFSLDADLVLLAIGQSKLGGALACLSGLKVEKGCLVTDDQGRTGRPGWFAGGDGRNGGKEVVNAAAEGKRAAIAIDEHLRGGAHA